MAVLAVLGVVARCLGPAIETGKLIAAPVKRQYSYLCCLRSNIKTLEDEAKILDTATNDLQKKVDTDKDNARIIFDTVDAWLKGSVKAKTETKEILDKAPDVGSGCLKLGERYSLSRKAMKATIAIKLHVVKCNFTEISYAPPPAAGAPVESGTTTFEFESRREIEEQIMKSLGDKNVNKIGICGMGGLGKTNMARKIMNNVLMKKELFDEAVMAVVSRPVDKLNIQLQIAGLLKLKFEDEILASRANLLRTRLRGNKRVLLVLDDVWGSLDMEELGIPCEDGCKVLITSRDSGVLNEMGVENVSQLKILDDEEAWVLFREHAGTCVDGDVNLIAKDVMRECKGLPLALEIVGLTLKDEKVVSTWEDALGQLRRSNPVDIPRIIKEVYRHLKLSYDRLDSENAKLLFLLCCLFPEDCEIPLEHLAYFATGLHLFQDIWELKKVRGRTSALVMTLKTQGLLLGGEDEDHVRMHDVARDVSIFIASEERRVKCSDCTWISSHVDGGARVNNGPPLPESFFPKLKLLLMNGKVEEEQEMDSLIGGSTSLNVLFIKQHGMLKSLPLIVSLTTLVLYNCASLKSIEVVGQMKSLEILICNSCSSIKELPEQVRGLNRLKLLQISCCYNLERVAEGVISSMVELEELKIVDSFKNWKGGEIYIDGEEGGKETARLRELEALEKLRCLDIEVSDVMLAAQPLRLSSQPVQFTVQFGKGYSSYHFQDFPSSYERRMYLDFGDENGINLGDLSANLFLTCAECLYACGTSNQDFKLNLASTSSIRWLRLHEFRNMKNITSATAAAFPLLEYLFVTNLYKLEEIWDDYAPIPSNSFTNLKDLRLVNLISLKRMGKSVISTAKDFFLQLEAIEIKDCGRMEHLLELVPNEEEQDKEDDIKTVLVFPKLKILRFHRIKELRSMICSSSRGIESIQFPLLSHIEIVGCDKLKCFVSRDDDDDDDDHYREDDGGSWLHLFCHHKVSFGNLQKLSLMCMESKNVWCDNVLMGTFTGLTELEISYDSKIESLFPSSKIAQSLVNLQTLQIMSCREMVKVIEDEEEAVSAAASSSLCDDHTTEHTTTHLFPSLQEINLLDLPKLESFCEWRCTPELPSLKILVIEDCHEMNSFKAVTPALQAVRINGDDLESVDDLNLVLHQQYLRKAKEHEEEEEEDEEGEEGET